MTRPAVFAATLINLRKMPGHYHHERKTNSGAAKEGSTGIATATRLSRTPKTGMAKAIGNGKRGRRRGFG